MAEDRINTNVTLLYCVIKNPASVSTNSLLLPDIYFFEGLLLACCQKSWDNTRRNRNFL